MKKFILLAVAMISLSVMAQDVAQQPFSVRYIDESKLYIQYVVAQQYNQLQTKLHTDFQAAEKKKRDQIETFYNQIVKKNKNGQYKSQKALEADQTKLEQMQQSAQKEMEAMQKQMEQQLNQEAQKLANEIDLFLADYAVRNGYDAILRKEASMFINPKWDVTDEVAEGLNARYNAAHAPEAKGEPEVDSLPTNSNDTTSTAK